MHVIHSPKPNIKGIWRTMLLRRFFTPIKGGADLILRRLRINGGRRKVNAWHRSGNHEHRRYDSQGVHAIASNRTLVACQRAWPRLHALLTKQNVKC